MALTALSLVEIAASKLVEPPGSLSETFTHLLFDRMHNGVDNEVASLCLVLLAELLAVVLAAAVGVWGWKWWKFTRPIPSKAGPPVPLSGRCGRRPR